MAPLVVVEALAAGTPVLGSSRGGIAELVHDGTDGLLVESGSVTGFRAALERLLAEPDLVGRLRAGITAPRTSADIAGEMLHLYRGLLTSGGLGGVATG